MWIAGELLAGQYDGAHGTLDLTESGEWTYYLYNASAAVQALDSEDNGHHGLTIGGHHGLTIGGHHGLTIGGHHGLTIGGHHGLTSRITA